MKHLHRYIARIEACDLGDTLSDALDRLQEWSESNDAFTTARNVALYFHRGTHRYPILIWTCHDDCILFRGLQHE